MKDNKAKHTNKKLVTLIQKLELTPSDKTILKNHIRISLIVGFLFCIALFVLVTIVPIIFILYGYDPAEGYVTRGTVILGILFIPFLAVSWKNLLKYVDIKRGKKFTIITSDYEIIKTKSSISLRLRDNENYKIEVREELQPLIDVTSPLKMDIAILSKTLLFISHDHKNLLED